MKGKLQGIFPEPIYFFKLERNLLEKEIKVFNKEKLEINIINKVSINNYILNNKILSKLKKELLLCVEEYFKNVIATKNKIVPYITQSWINLTNKEESHHLHRHMNSIVSGVFYIKANKQFDNISFEKDFEKNNSIQLNVEKYNAFNAKEWIFPVETGDVILFPSYLQHKVQNKKDEDTRISLAFNIFIKGCIGDKDKLTELFL